MTQANTSPVWILVLDTQPRKEELVLCLVDDEIVICPYVGQDYFAVVNSSELLEEE